MVLWGRPNLQNAWPAMVHAGCKASVLSGKPSSKTYCKVKVEDCDVMGQQEMQGLLSITPAAAVTVAVDDAGQHAVRSKAGGFLGHCVAAF